MPKLQNFLLCLGVVLLITIGVSCTKKNDAAAIRQLIQKGADLAEKQEIGNLIELTTKDFSAHPGNHNQRSVRGILFMAFRHYGRFKIHYPQPSVEIIEAGRTARAMLHFIIVSQDKPIPGLKELYEDPQRWIEVASEKADLYQLQLDLVKTDGDWQVKTARMSRLGI